MFEKKATLDQLHVEMSNRIAADVDRSDRARKEDDVLRKEWKFYFDIQDRQIRDLQTTVGLLLAELGYIPVPVKAHLRLEKASKK